MKKKAKWKVNNFILVHYYYHHHSILILSVLEKICLRQKIVLVKIV